MSGRTSVAPNPHNIASLAIAVLPATVSDSSVRCKECHCNCIQSVMYRCTNGRHAMTYIEERRIPSGCLPSVVSLLAGGDGSTRLERRGGSGGCVAVLGWVYSPRRTEF
jgi:hypothetical protein